LYYSDRLTELPLGIFAIAIATVILPALSGQRARADDPAFAGTLSWAVRSVGFIAIPATLALAVLAEPLLLTLFQYGAFGADDRFMAAASLRAYTLGLGAFMLVKVLAPGFYAREDMKTPVRIGIIAMVTNMVLNMLFVFPLMWWFEMGHVGLALATSVAAWLNATLLYRGLHRAGILVLEASAKQWLVKIMVSATVMSVLLLQMTPDMVIWTEWLWWERGIAIAMLCLAGLAAFLASLWVLGGRIDHLKR
jgi:putative peptidoglycan lipid II flippase